MNVENILTGILTGVITGFFTGYLGLRFAFKQFRTQRAFDKQLEWHERVVRVLGKHAHVRGQIEQARIRQNDKMLWSAIAGLHTWIAELQQCITEANLYADQKSYDKLASMAEKYEKLTRKLNVNSIQVQDSSKPKMLGAVLAELEAAEKRNLEIVNTVLRETLISIATPTRKMLGFKPIKLIQ